MKTREVERAEFFAECEQWSSESAARRVEVERWMTEQYGERGLMANEIDLSIERANRVEVVRPSTPAPRVGPSLRSLGVTNPSRLMQWAMPRLIALQSVRAMSERRLATDVNLASLFAGLVEVDAVTVEGAVGVLVMPRDAVPTWEPIATTPGKVRSVKAFNHSAIIPTAPVSLAERLDRVVRGVPYQHALTITEGVYLRSCADPGGYNLGALDLAKRADAFLAEHGEKLPTGDVWNERHMRSQSAPDRVAFRGEQRWVKGAPCRVQHGAKKVKGDDGKTHLVPALEKVAVGIDGQYELATILYCQKHHLKVLRGPRDIARRDQHGALMYQACDCPRTGWIGHRYVTFPPSRSKASVKQSKQSNGDRQATETATRKGPHVTAFGLSERSLARASKRVAVAALALENAVRALSPGEVVTFQNGEVVVLLGDACVIARDRSYPIREWSRRAALAGLIPVEVGEVEVEGA